MNFNTSNNKLKLSIETTATEVRFYEMTNVTVNICSDVADFRNEARNGNEWCKVHSVERTRGQTIECSS